MEQIEFIYCIHNKMFGSNVYKLGKTNNITQRLNAYTTAYIEPPQVIHAELVYNSTRAEGILFDILHKQRIKQNREFFNASYITIVKAMQRTAQIVNNNEDYEYIKPAKTITEEGKEIKNRILKMMGFKFDNTNEFVSKNEYEEKIKEFVNSDYWRSITKTEFMKVMNIKDKKYNPFSDKDTIKNFNEKFNNLFINDGIKIIRDRRGKYKDAYYKITFVK